MEIQMSFRSNQSSARQKVSPFLSHCDNPVLNYTIKGGKPKWRPSKIKDPEALCDDKDRCDGLKTQYNVSNKLLTWEKSKGMTQQYDSSNYDSFSQ